MTTYSFDTLGNLTETNQGAQQRKFRYDSLNRLTNQKLAEENATLNDSGQYVGSGTWSEAFVYDERSNLVTQTDARGVKTISAYNSDPLNRLQSVSYDTSGFGDTAHPILPAASVTYEHMASGDKTRLFRVTTAGVSTDEYGYDGEGRVSSRTLTMTSRPGFPIVTDYIYDSLNRVTDVRYPAQYGMAGIPRKLVHQDYDVASRLTGLKVDGADYTSQIVYNPASQTTSLKVGTNGTNQITENYTYDDTTGLLANQKVQRGASTLLDLSYDYLKAGTTSGRTGQLAKIINNLNRDKDRGYEYDALGRLTRATGGQSANWSQDYVYDRYGNRTSVTATGNTASASPANQTLPTDQLIAFNPGISGPKSLRADPLRIVSDSLESLSLTSIAANGVAGGTSASPSPLQGGGPSPVGYWKFDEGSGTTAADSSGSGNAGTLTNGPGWTTGRVNGALSFDGVNDHVQVGARPNLVMTNYFTVSAWIMPTDYNGGIIVNKEGEYEVAIFADGISWAIANTNPGWAWVTTGYLPPLHQWTHITIVYDNGVVKTYANGSLVNTYNGAGAIGDALVGMDDFRIGGRQWGPQYFQGRIDEVRMYNQALTVGDIQTLTQTNPSPVGYWKFDETSGTTAADSSGNGNTGTLTNGPGWTTGRVNNALSFDGVNDYVQVGARPNLVMSNYATVSAWIMPTTHAGIIANKEGEYEVALFGDGLYWAFANTNPGWAWINTGYVPPLNQWAHITIVCDNGVVKTYANGSLVNTYNGAGAIGDALVGMDDFRIGGRQWGPQYFQGRIDEVRVYNQALTVGDVQVLAAVNNPPTVSITQPADGATFTAPANITVSANASDTDGFVTQVEFFYGATSIGVDTVTPYSVPWNNVAAASYSLTARATDNSGATTTSSAVNITVNPAATPVPRDGLANVSYDQATNRINSAGWEYDAAGNQTRLQRADLSWQRHVYDAAGRLVKVQNDVGQTQIINTYGASNHRLIEQVGNETSNQRTYYAFQGDSIVAEFEETAAAPTTPRWTKSYVYLAGRLLATIAPSGASERVEYHHPDRLGTRVVTNNQDTTSFEQVTLPFGTALDAESSGSTKRRFTSYDRSTVTGLDYAVNRHYDPLQGRFTQVDPIGMRSSSLANPQTLNLYAYCANDPINRLDPSGLGFFSWLKRIFLKILAAFIAAVVAVVVFYVSGGNFAAALKVGWAVFKGALSASLGWQPAGGWGRTPPTFGNGPTLKQILGETSFGRRLTPNKSSFLTPGIAGNGFVAGSLGSGGTLPCNESTWGEQWRDINEIAKSIQAGASALVRGQRT